jgi:hypothetical protein
MSDLSRACSHLGDTMLCTCASVADCRVRCSYGVLLRFQIAYPTPIIEVRRVK